MRIDLGTFDTLKSVKYYAIQSSGIGMWNWGYIDWNDKQKKNIYSPQSHHITLGQAVNDLRNHLVRELDIVLDIEEYEDYFNNLKLLVELINEWTTVINKSTEIFGVKLTYDYEKMIKKISIQEAKMNKKYGPKL